MYLSSLKVWNFRKFGSTEFDLNSPHLDVEFNKGLNVLVGENDSGKSSIIDAIKYVLRTHSYEWIRYEESDFYDSTDRFRIEIVFSDFTDDEAKHFTEYLSWKKNGELRIPYLRLILDVNKNEERILPSDVRAGNDEEGKQLTAEAKEYLKTTYLKPLRDAETDLIAKRNSRLSQILLGDDAFRSVDEEHILVEIFEYLRTDLIEYFSGEYEYEYIDEDGEKQTEKYDEGLQIKKRIEDYIHGFFTDQHQVEFEANKNNLKSILEKISLSLTLDKNPGLGTLNRLYMAAELLHLDKPNWEGLRLGLIEELEAHLHPQAQMKVIETLNKIKSIQLILTTHSPNLASKIELEKIIYTKGKNCFPLGKEYTQLENDDYKFLERFLDVTKANLFFAEGVILVEGWSEELIIPSLASHIGFPLTKFGVSVINVGNTAFLRYSKIFLRNEDSDTLDIPVSIITDLDVKPDEEDEIVEGERKIDSIRKKMSKKYDSQNVKSFISSRWTLEYCMYKSNALGSHFETIVKEIHSGTNWNDFENVLTEKLSDKSLKKTEIAYRISQVLEEDLGTENKTIQFEADDTMHYLIDSISYVCGN